MEDPFFKLLEEAKKDPDTMTKLVNVLTCSYITDCRELMSSNMTLRSITISVVTPKLNGVEAE